LGNRVWRKLIDASMLLPELESVKLTPYFAELQSFLPFSKKDQLSYSGLSETKKLYPRRTANESQTPTFSIFQWHKYCDKEIPGEINGANYIESKNRSYFVTAVHGNGHNRSSGGQKKNMKFQNGFKWVSLKIARSGKGQERRYGHLLALSVAVALVLVTSLAAAADPQPFPNAGACTRYFRAWHLGNDNYQDKVDVCLDFMGINKYCADRDAFVAVGYVDATGAPGGELRTLKCSPRYHSDSIGDQFVHIWTGIGEGLITAAPFVAEGVCALTCVYGQIYACAVLSLQVSAQAGLEIPGEVGDAIYIAAKAPQCIDGDVVACAYLGARGAKAVGLEIPGVAAIDVIEDARQCNDGDFAACVRLGREAADAGGVETGKAFGTFVDGQACIDGDDDACITLAKEAIKDNVPLKGVAEGAESARACEARSTQECIRLGKQLASTASGLVAAVPRIAPFGANACISVSNTKGPVDLASVWDDRNATSVAVFPSDGVRFTAPFQASKRNGGWGDTVKWAAADFTGDGETDLLAIWDDGHNNTLTMRQSAEGGFTVAHWATRSGTWAGTTVWLPGDFDGDGHIDIAAAWNDQTQTSIAVYRSDGARFMAPVQWSVRNGGWGDTVKWAVGDFTGDGKADIAAVWNNGGTNTITVRQSTGSGFVPVHWASNAGGWIDSSVWLPGDFNGDGRLDLAVVWHDGNAVSIAVFPSNGGRFSGWSQWSERGGGWIDEARWTSGDFNGDGKTDLVATWNNGGTNTITVRQSTGSGFVPVHWASNAGGWSPSAAWCAGQFPDGFSSQIAQSDDVVDSVRASSTYATVKPQPRVRFGGTAPGPSLLLICDAAGKARERNSPAAPGLEQTCLTIKKGEAIANQDRLAVELRNQQPDDFARQGFDIGMAVAEGQTAPGPGKDKACASLHTPAEQNGCRIAVSFSVDRNRNAALASTGATIAEGDPEVATARSVENDVFYSLGFDIATGIFGDPALGAIGNTATGPGSLGIRDSLNASGQKGFNASVALHLSRNYRK
jgi:hypothetical protein